MDVNMYPSRYICFIWCGFKCRILYATFFSSLTGPLTYCSLPQLIVDKEVNKIHILQWRKIGGKGFLCPPTPFPLQLLITNFCVRLAVPVSYNAIKQAIKFYASA